MATGVRKPIQSERNSADKNNGDQQPHGLERLSALLRRYYRIMRKRPDRDAAQQQVRRFAQLLDPTGVDVYFREAAEHWTVFATLPQRELRDKVLEAQDEVAEGFGGPAFELIVLYPEDAERAGVKALLERASPA